LDELVKNGFLKDYLAGPAATPVALTPEEGQAHPNTLEDHLIKVEEGDPVVGPFVPAHRLP